MIDLGVNKVQGKARRKLKMQIKAAKYQDTKFGLTEAEKLRLELLENELKRKCNKK